MAYDNVIVSYTSLNIIEKGSLILHILIMEEDVPVGAEEP